MVFCALLAGCGPYPRDVEGTRDRVERERVIRVGWTGVSANQAALAAPFLVRLGQATGARIEGTARGTNEAMFALLEAGKLDLVVAELAEDSPWANEVTAIEPFARRRSGARVIALGAVARNGENRWIALLERTVRDAKARQ